MKRKHKIELTLVSIIVLANSAFLVYQFRFNRKFLFEQAHLLCERGQYDEAIPRCVTFLKRWEKGEYVEEARQELFCKALPKARTLLHVSDVTIAVEAFRHSKSQWIRDMAELALIHTGMEASMKPGGKYGAFLSWRSETLGDIGRPPGMVLAPAGELIMGSPRSEQVRHSDEGPQHLVRITKPFYLGKFEVTQQEYESVMGKNPSHFKGPNNPVEEVSWNEAVEFCRKLSERERREYRPPTEAEWEYACRADSQTRFYYGDDPDHKQLGDYAWYNQNTNRKTHPVGQKRPNAWGLYDVHGNVWEWCADWYGSGCYAESPERDPKGPDSGTARVLRGGSWYGNSYNLRASHSYCDAPTRRDGSIGFRCAGLGTP